MVSSVVEVIPLSQVDTFAWLVDPQIRPNDFIAASLASVSLPAQVNGPARADFNIFFVPMNEK